MDATYLVAALFVLGLSYLRVATVAWGGLRTIRNRDRFLTFQAGWAELITYPEPFLLAAAASLLAVRALDWSSPSLEEAVAAVVGALLAGAAWALIAWTLLSWRSMFVGHGVLEDHQLITSGAYGLVRHPVYLGAFMLWTGLAVAFLSLWTLLITILYVIPAYVVYMRSEEKMMVEAFGDPYRRYRQAVPMLVPRLRTRTAAAGGE